MAPCSFITTALKRLSTPFLICLLILLPSRSSSAGNTCAPPAADKIFASMSTVNEGLRDYLSDVIITLQASYGHLTRSMRLEGTYYYKSPGKSRMALKTDSVLLSKFPHVFEWYSFDRNDFCIRLIPEKEESGCYLLELIPVKPMGDMQKCMMTIDRKTLTIKWQEMYYLHDGAIRLAPSYKRVGAYLLYDRIRAQFSFPVLKLKALMEVSHCGHRLNQGLSDELFRKQ